MTRVPFAAEQRIGQDAIRLLLDEETLRVPLCRVRVEALGQPTMGLLDVVDRRAARHAERAVWIVRRCHLIRRP
jgi:hypothetical protein